MAKLVRKYSNEPMSPRSQNFHARLAIRYKDPMLVRSRDFHGETADNSARNQCSPVLRFSLPRPTGVNNKKPISASEWDFHGTTAQSAQGSPKLAGTGCSIVALAGLRHPVLGTGRRKPSSGRKFW